MTVKLPIIHTGTVKSDVIAVSGSLITTAIEKKNRNKRQQINLASKIPIALYITQTPFFLLGTQYPISSQSVFSLPFLKHKAQLMWLSLGLGPAQLFSTMWRDAMLLQ